MEYRKDIQGLRALAVILVFIFHLNPNYLSGGFIGVDVFFVISGYLMTTIILSKKENNSFEFISFYKSRIKRIVPAYYFVLLITSLFVLFIYIGTDAIKYKASLIQSIVFNSNKYFSIQGDYFESSLSMSPLLHTWTLAVEMQFYLFLPIILIFTKTKYLKSLILLLTLILFAYASYEIIFSNNKTSIYYSLIARTPEFFIGTLFCLISKKGIVFSNLKGLITASIGTFLILISAFLFNEKSYFPGFTALLPCIGTGLILISKSNIITDIFSKKTMVYIGKLSYSIYLWHWPIMALIRYYYNTEELNSIQIFATVLLTICLSLLSYYLVENPMRKKSDLSFVLSMSIPSILLAILSITLVKLNNIAVNIPYEYIRPSKVSLLSHGKDSVIGFFGDENSSDNIFLTGNSHALVLKEWLSEIGKNNNFSFQTITCDSYLPIPGIDKPALYDYSTAFYENSINLIPIVQEKVQQSDIIFIICSDWDIVPSFLSALNDFINNLKDSQDLIIIGTFPSIDKKPIQTNRSIIKNEAYSFNLLYVDNSNLLELISNKPNVSFYDLSKNDIFKNAPYFNDTLAYLDKNHLNIYGEKKLAEYNETDFMNFFTPILKKHEKKTLIITH